jgi:hypothetical protein
MSSLKKTAVIVDLVHSKMFLGNYNARMRHIFGYDDANVHEIDGSVVVDRIAENDRSLFLRYLRFIYAGMLKERPDDDRTFFFEFLFPFLDLQNNRCYLTVKGLPLIYEDDFNISSACVLLFQFDESGSDVAGSLKMVDMNVGTVTYFVYIQESEAGFVPLGEDELMFFRLKAEGFKDVEIADRLSVSHGTMNALKERVFLKLHATTSANVIAMITRQGFI